MSNTANVSAAKPKVGGAISVAPFGTALPTDAATALDAAYKNLGYVSEDGLTNNNTTDFENVRAWGGDIVNVIPGEYTDTYHFTLLEVLNPDVMKFIRGTENVTVASEGGTITVKANNKEVPEQVIVIEMIIKGRAVRHVIPRGVISERGEVSFSDSETVGYELTVTAMPDSNGNTHYEYYAGAASGSESGG